MVKQTTRQHTPKVKATAVEREAARQKLLGKQYQKDFVAPTAVVDEKVLNVLHKKLEQYHKPSKREEDELLDALKADKPVVPKDKLDHIKAMAKALRRVAFEIEDIEAHLSQTKAEKNNLEMVELPDLFNEYGIPSLTLAAEGNNPEVILKAEHYYKAVLPKDDPDSGLNWLKNNGHGDLIKRVFTIALPMDSDKEAVQLRKFLKKVRWGYEEKETVPWTTLTAFVKEQIEKYHKSLPLEILGAIVGKIVRMKPVKK